MTETVYNVTLFGIEMEVNPVAFTIPIGDGWKIYWYGIAIAIGFLLALIYAYKNASRFNVDFNKLIDVVIVTAPVSIIFARAYYLVFYQKSFENFWRIHEGGIAVYGSIIGAALAGVIMCRVKKISFFDSLDLAAVGFLIGQAIGRWGNFFNQEAFGSATGSSFWGMTSENIEYELGQGVLAHPCFLYESIWCIIGFFILHHFSKKRKFSGQLSLIYCAWYGLGRAIIEGFRTDSLMLGSFRVSQVLSVVICIASVVVLIIKNRKINKLTNSPEYIPQFAGCNDNTCACEFKEESEELNEAPIIKENVPFEDLPTDNDAAKENDNNENN